MKKVIVISNLIIFKIIYYLLLKCTQLHFKSAACLGGGGSPSKRIIIDIKMLNKYYLHNIRKIISEKIQTLKKDL